MMEMVKRFVCLSLLALVLSIGSIPALAAEKVDINTATVEQLVEVKGIGEVLAKRIVEYRQANGDFKSLAELTQVKGFGDKTLEKLSP
ncbi:MAG TPA: helix-hairpin-helix domain-containing protein, partial [Malonomonas sp.]